MDFTLISKHKLRLVTLALAILFSTHSFLITYSFLFGYYFGGEINTSFSNFEVFRRFVPFDVNTMAFTYLMISLSVTIIIYSLKFLKEKGLIFKFLAVLCLIIYHLMMTVFFSQEINMKNILLFGAIWVIPLLIGLMILFFIQGIKSPFKTYSGSIFGLVLLIIYIIFFNPELPEEWVLIWSNIALFSVGILFSWISYNKNWNFIFVFPYIFLTLAIIISVNKLNIFNEQYVVIKGIILICTPLFISIVLSYIFRNKLKEKSVKDTRESNSINNIILDIIEILFNPKTHRGAFIFIIIMLLGAYVITPRVSTATAKIIRSFTPESEFQFDLISVKNLNDRVKTIRGIIVAEHEGVLYISNKEWELEQVKTDNYFVEREN